MYFFIFRAWTITKAEFEIDSIQVNIHSKVSLLLDSVKLVTLMLKHSVISVVDLAE